MRKHILYLMHVDWDWIKQRPHFIAEYLSRRHHITIFYAFANQRANLSSNKRENLKVFPFFYLPFRQKYQFIYLLNRFLLRIYFFIIIKKLKPNYIWLTSPQLFDYLPKGIDIPLVYDCMDDVIEFYDDLPLRNRIVNTEKRLLKLSEYVFCSSNYLAEKLYQRGLTKEKCHILYNAYTPKFRYLDKKPPLEKLPNSIAIGYIGTISDWLDIDALLKCAQYSESICIHLIGPNSLDRKVFSKKSHKNIIMHGVVEHSELLLWAECFDILIMPFTITELVKSVDPVKLYEYIFFNKIIISSYYQELDRFKEFVYFYTNHDELISYLDLFSNQQLPRKFNDNDRLAYLAHNTWNNRIDIVSKLLNDNPPKNSIL